MTGKKGPGPARHSVGCPKCGCKDCRTTHTWGGEVSLFGKKIGTRRRRLCRYCGYVFHTFEAAEELTPEGRE